MAGTNWTLPSTGDTVANFTAELMARDVSAMTQQRTSLAADTTPPTGSIRWNDTNFNWESWNGSAWAALTTLYGISISGNAATATNSLSLGGALANTYAPLASPAFTGTPSLPTGATGVTQTLGDNTTKIASTAFVFAGLALKADLASPAFTGTPSLPTGATAVTQAAANNSTKIATTAYADAAAVSFPTGTRLTFNQTAAPTGWTKDVTAALNDSIMRIVTGTVGSGGSTAFSTFNGQTTTAAYTLAIADIPSHSHGVTGGIHALPSGTNSLSSGGVGSDGLISSAITISAQGGGGAHSHNMTTAIKYNDFIIASKN